MASESINSSVMDNFVFVAKKCRNWFGQLVLIALLVATVSAQASSASSDDPPDGEAQAPQAAAASTETTISSKEAKALFRSVDEILQFASQDTGLPIEHEVKRRLTNGTLLGNSPGGPRR